MFQPRRTRTISLDNFVTNYFRPLLIFYMTSAVRILNIFATSLPLACYTQLYTSILSNPTVIKPLGPVRTTRNFVCFAKKSVNAKPFSVRTIFFVHENFVKRHQTSETPSSSFGGLQFFVKRENLLFRDSYPSTGHHIS